VLIAKRFDYHPRKYKAIRVNKDESDDIETNFAPMFMSEVL
jgi:hypothetical protein